MAHDEVDRTTRETYFSALRLWVQQTQMHHNLSTCFPYYLMGLQGVATTTTLPAPGGDPVPLNNNWLARAVGPGVPGVQFAPPPPPPPLRHPPQFIPQRPIDDNTTSAEVIARHGGYEYVVAPLYKRVAAELVDFVMLFMLKLAVTYVAVDYFNYIDVDSFDVEALTKHFEDYKQAIEITSEILVLEFVYRFFVCLFEAACLAGGGRGGAGRAGGATPGKALLGLRVVNARAVLPVPGRARHTVLVYPAGDVGFPAALCRSALKNILISLLFPVFVMLFVFQDNRMGYDVLCNVIVVEENMFPPRRNPI